MKTQLGRKINSPHSIPRWMVCLLGIMCSLSMYAQVRVTGTVTDAQKEPVIGASVL